MALDREAFLEECKLLALNETEEEKQGLVSFLQTAQGMRLLGRLQLAWEERLMVGPMQIPTTEPGICVSRVAELQGTIRGIMLSIDRLLGDIPSV